MKGFRVLLKGIYSQARHMCLHMDWFRCAYIRGYWLLTFPWVSIQLASNYYMCWGKMCKQMDQINQIWSIWQRKGHSVCTMFFSRKRPRRVLSKKALSLNIVIKHCLKFCWSDGCLERLSSKTAQSSAEVMAVFKDCHQRLPKVLLKWWLSLKIVIKDCPKFCWSDGCLERLSSKTAQSSAEVMAVFKDCHQRLPKVLLKWWLSPKTREKTANLRLEKKIREKTANLQRLEKRTREKTAEKDC